MKLSKQQLEHFDVVIVGAVIQPAPRTRRNEDGLGVAGLTVVDREFADSSLERDGFEPSVPHPRLSY